MQLYFLNLFSYRWKPFYGFSQYIRPYRILGPRKMPAWYCFAWCSWGYSFWNEISTLRAITCYKWSRQLLEGDDPFATRFLIFRATCWIIFCIFVVLFCQWEFIVLCPFVRFGYLISQMGVDGFCGHAQVTVLLQLKYATMAQKEKIFWVQVISPTY